MNDQSHESKLIEQESPTKEMDWTSIIKSHSQKVEALPNRTLESYQQALIEAFHETQTVPSKVKRVKKNVNANESNL